MPHPKDKAFLYRFPIYADGETIERIADFAEAAPPADLQSRHLWPANPPTFETKGAAIVTGEPYAAKGDGVSDDTRALRRAIEENEIVFLPKGHYLVSEPIDLKPNTKLIGVSAICSNICLQAPGAHFADPEHPEPLLRTADSAAADNYLAFFSATIPRAMPGAYAFRHRSSPSVIRTCRFGFHHQIGDEENRVRDLKRGGALVLVSGNAGGQWHMHYEEQPIKSENYTHLRIDSTRRPLDFYHLNIEHAFCGAQMEIRNAENIRIFGYKTERNSVVLRIAGSRNIALYGYGGNATAFPGGFLIDLVDSSGILLASLVDQGRIAGDDYDNVFGIGVPPSQWSMLRERLGERELRTLPGERPACYWRR
ncbi:MAG: Pectate lyase superfamily protein [candidate division BRC1 bacterium ADurb.BinA364]|nr:MAG: Pectate lyase superfamily protein [candidate division BRC1 bacterium ADurb.BinA364]